MLYANVFLSPTLNVQAQLMAKGKVTISILFLKLGFDKVKIKKNKNDGINWLLLPFLILFLANVNKI